VPGDTITVTSAFFGPHLQYWVRDNLFIGGGAGFSIFKSDVDGDEGEVGFGLDARAGWAFLHGRYGALFLSGEITPSIYDSVTVLGVGLKVGAQLY
jgi:hypothetical protein